MTHALLDIAHLMFLLAVIIFLFGNVQKGQLEKWNVIYS